MIKLIFKVRSLNSGISLHLFAYWKNKCDLIVNFSIRND